MLKLFFSPGACSLASHITLAEAGAAYEVQRLDFSAGAQRKPEYLAVNPKGRVPALVTDKGVLTETPSILVYLAQTFPAAKLAPLNDPWAFARVQELNSYLCSTVHVHHAHRTRGSRWADDEAAHESMKKKVASNVGDCFQLMETQMFKGPWVMGEAYTICDPYLYTVAGWLEGDSIDPKRYPRIFDHRTRMSKRPAVQKALAEEGVKPPA